MSDNPSIAFFLSFSGPGGVERMMINLAHGIDQAHGNLEVLSIKTTSRHLEMLSPSIRHVPLGTSHTLEALPILVRYLKRRRPAALLAAKNRANIIAILARHLAKVDTRIVVRMGTTTSVALAGKHPWQRLAYLLPMRLAYRHADEIVAVSWGVANDIGRITKVNPKKITVIPNPVITPRFHDLAREPLNHPWFQNKEVPIIVAMGRLTRQKDFPTLLKAFRKVRSIKPCRLVILGSGQDKKILIMQAIKDGVIQDVDFPGFVPNPYPYLRRADLFVLSSLWEGSPNSLTEAMALGIPVVATHCPSGPRELLQDGKVAPIVPVRNPDAMARAILDTMDNPPDKEKLRRAVSLYTMENSTRLYLDVLLGKSRRGIA